MTHGVVVDVKTAPAQTQHDGALGKSPCGHGIVEFLKVVHGRGASEGVADRHESQIKALFDHFKFKGGESGEKLSFPDPGFPGKGIFGNYDFTGAVVNSKIVDFKGKIFPHAICSGQIFHSVSFPFE
jgi:hypothetical protein